MSVVLARSRLLQGGLVFALAAVPFGLAFGASTFLAGPAATPAATPAAGPAATPIATPAGVTSPHDCAGGEEDRVTVALAPEAISAGRGGDRMAVAIDVHHHLGAPAAIVGTAEVIDDRGRRIGAARDLAVRSVPASARTGYRLETPDRLADGYYRVQVSVLARAGGEEDFSTHQLYFHMAGGSLAPITSHDWLTQSASGLTFTSP